MKKTKKERKKRSICPKCLTKKVLHKHHLLPQRHFKKQNTEEDVLFLCEDCHLDIERVLPERKLAKEDYQAITFAWMRGYSVTVV